MLRSWTERIRVYLHPEHLVLVREAGVVNKRVVAKQVVAIASPGEHLWSGVLAALQTSLRQPEWQQARAMVTLSGKFARYRVVPWELRLTQEERIALLRHQYEELYGEDMRGWQLVTAQAGFGKQGLACAIDTRLMAAVQDTFARSSVRLTSVRPYLMAAFNQWRRDIGGQGAWLILAEHSLLTIALLQNGEWRGVRSHACASGWETSLELMLAREALHHGVDATRLPVYLFWPERPGFKPDLAWNAPVQLLNLPPRAGYSPQVDRGIAEALL